MNLSPFLLLLVCSLAAGSGIEISDQASVARMHETSNLHCSISLTLSFVGLHVFNLFHDITLTRQKQHQKTRVLNKKESAA